MNENIIKYSLNVFIIVLLIFSITLFINTIGLNLNEEVKNYFRSLLLRDLKTLSKLVLMLFVNLIKVQVVI